VACLVGCMSGKTGGSTLGVQFEDRWTDLFRGLGLDVVGEPGLESGELRVRVLFWFSSDRTGTMSTYQTLKDTSTICGHTGRNVPQLVLKLGQLERVGNFLRAQV
jgi:hypothetical protein